MNLQETVQKQLNGLVEDGTIEKIVKEKVTKTLDDIIGDSLRSYSDFGKQLSEVVKNAMQISFEKVSVVGYQKIITDIVKRKLEEKMMSDISEPLGKEIDELFGDFEKKEYKLSELLQVYMQNNMPDDSDGYCEISFHVEESNYGSIHIGFDKKSDKTIYKCDVRFSLNKEGKIYTFEVGEYSKHRGDILRESLHGEFDRLLFNIYASGSVIIVDENNCQTEYYHEGY